jgi:hypothetical protein
MGADLHNGEMHLPHEDHHHCRGWGDRGGGIVAKLSLILWTPIGLRPLEHLEMASPG